MQIHHLNEDDGDHSKIKKDDTADWKPEAALLLPSSE